MIYLVVAVLLNVVISAIFKVFPKYNINTFQAIVANYCVCVATGLVFIGRVPGADETIHTGWFPWALMMGGLFISIFYLLGHSTKVDGITTTIIANKLSIVIPVLFSVLVYKELAGAWKIVGILIAFPAIYLTAHVKGENGKPQNLLLPVLIFLGGGTLDTLMKFMQSHYLPSQNSQALFAIFCFSSASVIGTVIIMIAVGLKMTTLQWRNILAGIILGIPNYFSIYFLIRMLDTKFLQSSALIPVFNISILIVSTLSAIIFFSEKVNKYRVVGLTLSIMAILLIAFGDK